MLWRLACLLLLTTLSACAQQSFDPSEMDIVLDLPAFAEQVRSDDCASVALSSLLQYYGHQISPDEIDREVYDPVLGGSLLLDLETFAAKQGLKTHSGRGNLELLQTLLKKKIPVLLPIDLGWGQWRRPHYVVIFGYSPNSFLIHKDHDTTTEISHQQLEKKWGKAGSLYLYLEEHD